MAMGCSGADETTAEPEFTFQPKVCSHFYEDIYGTAQFEYTHYGDAGEVVGTFDYSGY